MSSLQAKPVTEPYGVVLCLLMSRGTDVTKRGDKGELTWLSKCRLEYKLLVSRVESVPVSSPRLGKMPEKH
ncbi:hypothetical protein RRG08_025173 [Elysia crispata]|uniref:Uncharacterized protein n=1 Tax=Elysia crispata TaxID=231223 RepID=A0AAE1DD84_9GAST|nr:hypothetical protein RRG08_025173 [Elysia crispata]